MLNLKKNGESQVGIIQCAEKCKYQNDGYCLLNKCIAVNSVSGACPYFTEKSFDKSDCLGKPAYSDKLH